MSRQRYCVTTVALLAFAALFWKEIDDMWFKNIKAYRLTQPLSIEEDALQTALNEFAFRPCGSQETATMGFAAPLHAAGQHTLLYHQSQLRYWITLKKQERLLPASVVNAELTEKVEQIEAETGSPIGKKAQSDLKQQIITRLLPQAFTKNTYVNGFISVADNLVVVDASADGKAEAFLAMLRKALGSLPVVPLVRHSLQIELTQWLTTQPPENIVLLEEAEFKSTDESGSIIRCKNQPLDSDEIQHHLDAGKLVQKVAFEFDESIEAILQEDGSIKRVKFTDRIKEDLQDIPKDQVAARLDAEFTLMSAETCRIVSKLSEALKLETDLP